MLVYNFLVDPFHLYYGEIFVDETNVIFFGFLIRGEFMKIKIRTGIFEVQNFNLVLENQKIFLRNAENQIIFSIQEIEKIEIIATILPAKVNFHMTDITIIEGFFISETDIDNLIADAKKENITLELYGN